MTEPQLAAAEKCQEETAKKTSQGNWKGASSERETLSSGSARKAEEEVRNRRVCFRFFSILQIVGDSQRAESIVKDDEISCSGLNLYRVNIVLIIIVLSTFLGTGRWYVLLIKQLILGTSYRFPEIFNVGGLT